MNRIEIANLSGVKALDNAEMSAVTGGLVLLKRKYPVKLLVRRIVPKWIGVLLNPQPLPPR